MTPDRTDASDVAFGIDGTPIETRRSIKRRYLKAEIGLSDAVSALMDHHMMLGEAYAYLGL